MGGAQSCLATPHLLLSLPSLFPCTPSHSLNFISPATLFLMILLEGRLLSVKSLSDTVVSAEIKDE